MKLIVLVGLPGSGKTFYGNQLAEQLDAIFLDDFSQTGGLSLLETVNKQNCIISDVHLCILANRNAAQAVLDKTFPDYDQEWIYFENKPDICLANVKHRNDGRNVERTIDSLTKYYQIPEGAVIREVLNYESSI